MNLRLLKEPRACLLRLEGTFTFESHAQFRAATQELVDAEGTRQITLDFSGLSYLDSSSLGMLLMLRDKAVPKEIHLVIAHPTPTVLGILKVVQFDKLFEIQEG